MTGGSPILTRKIALAHMKDYLTTTSALERMAAEGPGRKRLRRPLIPAHHRWAWRADDQIGAQAHPDIEARMEQAVLLERLSRSPLTTRLVLVGPSARHAQRAADD